MIRKNKIAAVKHLYEGMQSRFYATSNLHESIKYTIRIAQIFGLFPVSNILSPKYALVTFKWLSPFTIYSILSLVGTTGLLILSLVRLCVNEFKLHLLDSCLFCLNAVIVIVVFFKLSMEWPNLLFTFCKTENLLRHCSYQKNLKITFLMLLFVSTASIMLEHALAISNTYMNINPEEVKKLNRSRLQQYFIEEFPFIFDYFDYSLVLGLLVFYINLCNVFSWGFIDCFIMIMSYAVAYRFKQINIQLKTGIKNKIDGAVYWNKMREDYSQMAILCQKVNKRMGNIIIVSFGANMFFIVTQLYKGLVTRKTTVDQCYFIYSFGVLVLRTICVIIYGSMVHSESKKPLSYLVSVRNETFNLEVRRFILQVYTQDTTLSGGQYFSITRSLLFTMAASIITYELFMVQAGISIYI